MLPSELNCSFYGFNHPLEEAELLILGIPYYEKAYGGKPSIPPTSFLRILSRYVEDNYVDGDGYYSSLKIRDIGDLQSSDEEDIELDIASITRFIEKTKKKLLMIGGSHMYTYYMVKSLRPHIMIVFDAHLDLKRRLMGHEFSHATYLRRIIEEKHVDKILVIGSRAYEEEEVDYGFDKKIFRINELSGVREWIMELDTEDSKVYISIDLDHLDPSHMPHVTNPEPLGLHPWETFKILSYIRETSLEVIGGDVVEYSPYTLEVYPGVLASRICLELARTILKT